MHFIFGGRCMGKLAYARSLIADPVVCDLSVDNAESMFDADIICNVHLLVKALALAGGSLAAFFEENLSRLQGKIIIGDEVGSGVVPVEAFERDWRDETGRVYQLLSKHAKDVTRVWAGIPQALKRDGRQL